MQVAQHAGYLVTVEVTYDAHLQRKSDGEASTDACFNAYVQMEDGTKRFVDATDRHPIHTESHLKRGAATEATEAYKMAQAIFAIACS